MRPHRYCLKPLCPSFPSLHAGATAGTHLRQAVPKDVLMALLYKLIWIDAFLFLVTPPSPPLHPLSPFTQGLVGVSTKHHRYHAPWIFFASSAAFWSLLYAVYSRPDVVERVMERVDDAVQTVAPDSSRSSRKVTCSALLPLPFQWHAYCLVLFQWLTCCSCACSHWPIC